MTRDEIIGIIYKTTWSWDKATEIYEALSDSGVLDKHNYLQIKEI